jgi:hypothetical protein
MCGNDDVRGSPKVPAEVSYQGQAGGDIASNHALVLEYPPTRSRHSEGAPPTRSIHNLSSAALLPQGPAVGGSAASTGPLTVVTPCLEHWVKDNRPPDEHSVTWRD